MTTELLNAMKAPNVMSTTSSVNDAAALGRAARAMAEHAGWLQWDSATTCADTPNGNEPEEERAYWLELAQVAFTAHRSPGAAPIEVPAQPDPVISQMRQALQSIPGTVPLVRLFLREDIFHVGYVARLVDTAQSRCAAVDRGLDELNGLEQVALRMLCDVLLKQPGE